MKKKYLLGVDIGTSETKGTLCDTDGNIMGTQKQKHDLLIPQPGFAEHDPAQWWSDFCSISNGLIAACGIDAADIVGVGCSAVASGLNFLDENFNPVRNTILYGIDTRSLAEIEEIHERIGKDQIQREYGETLSVDSYGPKILWVKNNQREIFDKVRYITISPGYINLKLTGKNCIDVYSAYLAAPIYDRGKRDWISERCDYIASKELLPEIFYSSEVIGHVTADAEKETGIKAGTPVVCGTTDAGAEALSGGVSLSGDTLVMYGSTVFVVHVTDRNRQGDNSLWNAVYLFPDTYTVLSGMATTGSLTQWLVNTLGNDFVERARQTGENIFDMLFTNVDSISAGSDGLIVLPYFAGERMPIKDPLAKGVIFGLNLAHTRDHIVRAALEGIGYGLAQSLDIILETGLDMKHITAIGGGTKSEAWMQIMSDITGLEHRIMEKNEGASYGDAMLAALGTGVATLEEIKNWNKISYCIKPNPNHRQKYDEGKKLFKRLYEDTKELMHII